MTGSEPTVRLETTLSANSLFFLSALGEEDVGYYRKMTENIQDIADQHKAKFIFANAMNKDELKRSILNMQSVFIRGGHKPLLHLEMHGNVQGGIIGATGDLVRWEDLVGWLRNINIAMNNNLVVLLGACFGFGAATAIDFQKQSPFYVLLSPTSEIQAGVVQDRVPRFYRTLIESKNLQLAIDQLGSEFETFDSEGKMGRLFTKQLSDLVKPQTIRYLTELKANGTEITEEAIARNIVSCLGPKDIRKIEASIRRFMIGRDTKINLELLVNEVAGAVFSMTKPPRALALPEQSTPRMP